MDTLPTINTAAELEALRDCSAAVINAPNGHVRRWARASCTARLVRAGHSLEAARSLAASSSAFGEAFGAIAKASIDSWKRGAQ